MDASGSGRFRSGAQTQSRSGKAGRRRRGRQTSRCGRRGVASENGLRALADACPGDSGEVVAVEARHPIHLAQLGARGLVPGARVQVVQRGFGIHFVIEGARYAINGRQAAEVILRLDEPEATASAEAFEQPLTSS